MTETADTPSTEESSTRNRGAEPPAAEFDVVVIGAGPVGEVLAQRVTEGTGLSAALVEAELLGGECSYYACIPSKTLLSPMATVDQARNLPGAGSAELDVRATLSRRDTWVSDYDDAAQVEWAEGVGITVVRGRGRVVAEKTVEVTDGQGAHTVRARRAVVVATGSEAHIPQEFADAAPWTSRDATGVQEVPETLAIIGGGVVACEAATWMSGLGSEVTMLVRGPRLLSGFEPEAGQVVLETLRDRGVTVHLETSVESCERPGETTGALGRLHGGPATLMTSAGRFITDELLAATGRQPRLEGVGADFEDQPPWLHLIGDASSEAPLTHWGKYRARQLGDEIAADARGPQRGAGATAEAGAVQAPVPQAVFTDPPVASVGLTEAEAREAGVDVVTAEASADAVAGISLLRDDARGTAKIVVDRSTGCLVGATFAAHGLTEVMHSATVAIVGEVPVHRLRHAVPSFPTPSEVWLGLLESLPSDLTVGAARNR